MRGVACSSRKFMKIRLGFGRLVPRKRDFPDAERLVKRLVAQELTLSFVAAPEQRLWRTVMRGKYQLTQNRVQLQNRLGSSSDLFGSTR